MENVGLIWRNNSSHYFFKRGFARRSYVDKSKKSFIIQKNIKDSGGNMDFFRWQDSYSVGVESIDEQHKKLIKMMNDLHASMMAGKSKEVLQNIFDELFEYTAYHFSSEEELMKEYGFPETEEHGKLHNNFVERVRRFKEDAEKGGLFISIDVMDFLRDWLSNHILKVDMDYARYLKDNNII